jgi:DNA segregation ATPase FtsK/SpoIIIE, S-DNA-T family
VFLVIDGWFTVRQEYEKLEQQLQEVASRGLSYGVHLVVVAGRWSEVRPWLRDVLQTRFELRLGDSMESEIDFRTAKSVPEIPGRGITVDKYHYLAALPRLDGRPTTDDLGEGLAALVDAVRQHWTGPRAPSVRLLPRNFAAHQLPPVPCEGELRVPYGLDEERLEPVWHDFALTPHLLVFGDGESGKTNLARLFARAIVNRFTPQEAKVLLVDPRRRLQDAVPANQLVGYVLTTEALKEVLSRGVPHMRERMPGPDISPEQLSARDWWTGPRLFVIIDDYDMVGGSYDNPAQSLTELLAQGLEIGLHVIIFRRTSGGARTMMSDALLRRMWDLGTPGLLFSCQRDESHIFGETKPLTLPPGRAQLVIRREGTKLVQTGLVTDPADPADPPDPAGPAGPATPSGRNTA